MKAVLSFAQTVHIKVNIAAKHAEVCMAEKLCKFCVADLPYGFRRVGVPVGIHDELLASLNLDAGTPANPIHFFHKAVLRIGLAEHI